jgi:hypothetical protein
MGIASMLARSTDLVGSLRSRTSTAPALALTTKARLDAGSKAVISAALTSCPHRLRARRPCWRRPSGVQSALYTSVGNI